MGTQAQVRKRAVCLTPEGVEALKLALNEKWRTDNSCRKLTKEARAEILGLSPATSERVLNGKGVDRVTLTLAFKNVGIAWDERYCQPLERDKANESVHGSEASPPPKSNRMPRTAYFALGGAVLMLMPLVARSLVLARPVTASARLTRAASDPGWMTHINDTLYEANQKYRAGDFGGALHLCREGIALARESHSNPLLFTALLWTSGHEQALGSFADAKAHLEEAAVLDNLADEEQNRHAVYKQLGDLEIKMGDFASAGLNLQKALTLATAQENGAGVCQAKSSLGWLAFKQGDLTVASEKLNEALAAVPQPAVQRIVVDIKSRQALLLAQESLANSASSSLLTEAITQLNASLDFWKSEHHARWIAHTEKQLGAVEALAGHFEISDALLTQSREGFKKVGDTEGSAQAALLLSKSHNQTEFREMWRTAL